MLPKYLSNLEQIKDMQVAFFIQIWKYFCPHGSTHQPLVAEVDRRKPFTGPIGSISPRPVLPEWRIIGDKYDLRTHILPLFDRICVFSAALRATPMLESPRWPMKNVLCLRLHQRNLSKSVCGNTIPQARGSAPALRSELPFYVSSAHAVS